MSVEHLKRVVEAAKSGHAVDGIVADKALLELDAIVRTARSLVELWGYAGNGNPAETLIREIAKDAL